MLKELRVFNQDNITKIYKLEDSKARMSMSIEGETTIMYFVLEDLGIETSDYDDMKEVNIEDWMFNIEYNPDNYEEEGMRKIMKKISELEFDKILMPN